MHELSICQALITQLDEIARENKAQNVISIRLQIGPLSGVEAPLLKNAFPIAAAGTIAEQATLELETVPIRIRCLRCNAESEASINQLVCGACGDYHTELISGDEMLLASVELDTTYH